MKTILDESDFLSNNISKILVPVLIVRGENSDVLSVDAAEKMRKSLSDAELVEIEGTTHGLLCEAPLKSSNLIKKFLN